MKNKKILIIGGAGFIGSSLVDMYYKDNKVVVIDNCDFDNSPLKKRNLNIEKITFINKDANDTQFMLSQDTDYDYIIHASAILGIKRVCDESINTIITNIKTCYNALELATKQKHLKKFLTFSSSEIYGINPRNPIEDNPAIIEKPNEARWCYAASKTVLEQLTFSYHREKGIPTIIIRPFNVFGEYRTGSNAMTTFIHKAMNNEDIIIYGNGKQERSWCYIDDFVDGVNRALISKYDYEVFNLGNPNNSITIKNLAKLIIKITNSKSKIIITNSKEPDVYYRGTNIDKAKELLNYNPTVSLEEAIKKTSLYH